MATFSHGRTLDRVPSIDPRNANYPVSHLLTTVSEKTWRAWVERHIADLNSRVAALEGVVPPPSPVPPTPPPSPVPPQPVPPAVSVLWDCPVHLDQGPEGECVGFGFADFCASQPKEQAIDVGTGTDDEGSTAELIYESAQQINRQPADEQSGTSVTAGAKAVQKMGRITAYHWATTINDVIASIQQLGPVVLGIDWTNDMFHPDKNGRVYPTGGVAGGHCLIARGYEKATNLLTLRNSWGSSWGIGGDCKISAPDLDGLLQQQGEACVPTKV